MAAQQPRTLFDKIWDAHVVETLPDGTKVDMEAMKRMAEQMNRQMAQQPRDAGK